MSIELLMGGIFALPLVDSFCRCAIRTVKITCRRILPVHSLGLVGHSYQAGACWGDACTCDCHQVSTA